MGDAHRTLETITKPGKQIQIIGAGLAGLAAALTLTKAGHQVTIHEAAPQAGGRCRSYFDPTLGCRLDNGNHLLLSGNRATMQFLDEVGARHTLTGPATPLFPFVDLQTGHRWTLRPNQGRLPWWLLVPSRRVPGMRLRDALPALRLHTLPPETTVAQALPPGVLYHRLLEPLAIAALNTPPDQASARLLGAIMQETLLAGGAACIPAFPREGLSESFIDPALATLATRGATIRFGARIATLADLPDLPTILAVPAPVATALLPGLQAPDQFEAILNVHYRVDADPGPAGFYGIIGGAAEWIFVKRTPEGAGIVSVTISAGNRTVDTPPDALAQQVWQEVCTALQREHPIPAYRVIKEKRATFAATPAQDARRPGPRTSRPNVVLAGDWTATGLPATIEGAIRSGRAAAALLL